MTSYKLEWDRIVEDTLNKWLEGDLDLDEDLEPPSPRCLAAAKLLAEVFRDAGTVAPHRIVPDGEGGVSFESERICYCKECLSESWPYPRHILETLTVDRDQRLFYAQYVDCCLVSKEEYPSPSTLHLLHKGQISER